MQVKIQQDGRNRKTENFALATVQKQNKSSAAAEMGDRLATIDMGRKLGAVPLIPIRGTAPNFRPMSIVAKRSPISAAAGRWIPM